VDRLIEIEAPGRIDRDKRNLGEVPRREHDRVGPFGRERLDLGGKDVGHAQALAAALELDALRGQPATHPKDVLRSPQDLAEPGISVTPSRLTVRMAKRANSRPTPARARSSTARPHASAAQAKAARRGAVSLFANDDSPRLDARTRSIGLEGVARARQVLADQLRRAEAREQAA
jgi:hypothetical protein